MGYTIFEFCNAIKSTINAVHLNSSNVFYHPYYVEITVLGNNFLLPGMDWIHSMALESIRNSNKSFSKNLLTSLVVFVIVAFLLAVVLWVPYYKKQKNKVSSAFI